MKQALADFNIEIVPMEKLKKEDIHAADLWALINPPKINHASAEIKEQFIPLPFEVRYQLEVCISRDILNEYNITKQFVKKLAQISSEDPVKARNILEYAAGQEKRIYEPITIFDDPEALTFSAKTDIPHYCAYSRKATITPSTIYFSSPTVETTNRVLRHYARENLEGRFLRVQFTDELSEVCLPALSHDQA
jgi:RNA-dependent RNA polymerase